MLRDVRQSVRSGTYTVPTVISWRGMFGTLVIVTGAYMKQSFGREGKQSKSRLLRDLDIVAERRPSSKTHAVEVSTDMAWEAQESRVAEAVPMPRMRPRQKNPTPEKVFELDETQRIY